VTDFVRRHEQHVADDELDQRPPLGQGQLLETRFRFGKRAHGC
jgi:hypothetical protein